MALAREDLLGTWTLVRTYETLGGVETGISLVGHGATGVIHYLPDDRVAVLIASGGRLPVSRGRYDSGDAETAESARTFTAYAGTFEVRADDIVVHHLDLCLYEDHAGKPYVRHVRLEADRLTLSMPPDETPEGVRQGSLEWRRSAAFPAAALWPDERRQVGSEC